MNGTLVGVLTAIFALGLLLVFLGRRGRRINDHPQCRWCGFDLVGVYPASSTCPECGAGLKRDGAVRNGVRKRMGWMVAVGVLTALLPLAPMATVLYAAATGTNLAKYTPTGILLWQTRVSSVAANKAIADELIDRLIKKQLDKSQITAVTTRVLEIQADQSQPWDEVWGDVIERLNLNGDLTKEQLTLFYKQATGLTSYSRPVVRPGDALPVIIKSDGGRVGSRSQLMAMVSLDSAKLDDVVLKKPSTRGPSLFGSGGSSSDFNFYMFGTKSNTGWIPGQTQDQRQLTSLTVPKNTPPGQTTLTMTVLCRVSDYQGGWSGGRLKTGDPGVTSFTFTQPVKVVPADTDPITRITPTSKIEQQMRTALEQTAVTANVSASGSLLPIFGAMPNINRAVTAQLTIDKPPAPFAFEVFVRLRDKETKIGEITSAPAASEASGRMYGPNTGSNLPFYLGAEVPNLRRADKKVDLIFRPSTRAAISTIELTEIYGGEIVLKDFAVTRNAEDSTAPPAPADDSTTTPTSGDNPKTSPAPAEKP